MKRGPEVEHVGLYAFNIDTTLRYQRTTKERDFLKKLHLEDFSLLGVLHTQLVIEAITALEPNILITPVKGDSVPLIAKNCTKQF